jgi:hypothetical protein
MSNLTKFSINILRPSNIYKSRCIICCCTLYIIMYAVEPEQIVHQLDFVRASKTHNR